MKKRYLFFGLLVLIDLYYFFVNGSIFHILGLLGLIYTLYLTNSIEKNSKKDGALTKREKIQVIITELLDPLIAGAFYYYCWKTKLPKKAHQANQYSLLIFICYFVLIFIFLMLYGMKNNP